MQSKSTRFEAPDAQNFFHEVTAHVIEKGGRAEILFQEADGVIKAHLSAREQAESTLDDLCRMIILATKEVLENNTQKAIHYAKTVQMVPSVHLRPDIGCFVQFDGDYQGLMIMNFSGAAALSLYQGYMITMGMPADELAQEWTSDEVIDSVGEFVNQIIGQFRMRIEQSFGLTSQNSQPKAIGINESVTLSIGPASGDEEYRRISFKVDNLPFQTELALEATRFKILAGM